MAHTRALSLLGYRGSHDVHLEPGVRITDPSGLVMGHRVRLCRGVKVDCLALGDQGAVGQCSIGDGVFVGERTTISCYAKIVIGAATMIAHNCSIMDANHGTAPGVPLRQQPGYPAEVIIGEDCWLGTGVIVLPGVTIGNGTIVGAGSVVTANLPPNVVAAGVPARVLRPR